MKTIVVLVAADGTSRVETHGFVGDECRIASRFLEKALGRTTSEELTAEFHQVSTQENAHLYQGE
ncbi:DUF2997 domain-containing protein [Blastopirellula sp. JC732]|uniref:DUF2997 domain-containing protein n=1 Tax=Blastopirellula sediminis TaxID=2894196 RepID=A0A9X1MII7_9BACT|nr:DUF2997 domain-containing protein [Blastopirellula sediminis]MCC9607702.1 DUF2997 domain-containing protein [Blastopirellula sediminis]MCC9627504.1 DUF2997 domain-containing protein [Blastopirellula sediminis]